MSEKKSIDWIFDHKVTTLIALYLSLFGSLNLKELVKLMDQSKTSIFSYLKEMLKAGIIRLDSDKTEENWGKYYQLCPEYTTLFFSGEADVSIFSKSEDSIVENSHDLTGEEIAKYRLNVAEMNTAINLLQGKFLRSLDMNSQLAISSCKLMLSSMVHLPLYTEADQIEFVRIVKNFLKDLTQLAKNQTIKQKPKDDDLSSLQVVYLSVIPLGKIRQELLNKEQ